MKRLNLLIRTRDIMAKHAELISKDKNRTNELLILLAKIKKMDELIEKIDFNQMVFGVSIL